MPFGKPSSNGATATPVVPSVNQAAMNSAVADAGPVPVPVVEAQVVTDIGTDEEVQTAPQTTPSQASQASQTPPQSTNAKVDLKALLEERTLELGGFFEATEQLDDTDLFQTPDQQAAFQAFTQAIGVPEYDISSAKTFQYVVTSTGSRFLKGPQVQAYGDPETAQTCCVVWDYQKTVGEGKDAKEVTDQHVLPLPADANVNSIQWRISPPQGDNPYCEILFEVKKFKFPFPLRVDTAVWKKGQDLMNALLEVENFADLAKFLLDGSPVARWTEGYPDELLVSKASKLQRGDGSEFLVCSAIDVNQKPYRI
ncbi:hypothetical protein U2F10_03085 [Leptothoe sp. EHU-05/26/07-4]